jgi:hypothetical protein
MRLRPHLIQRMVRQLPIQHLPGWAHPLTTRRRRRTPPLRLILPPHHSLHPRLPILPPHLRTLQARLRTPRRILMARPRRTALPSHRLRATPPLTRPAHPSRTRLSLIRTACLRRTHCQP